jgi:hypothetical protein
MISFIYDFSDRFFVAIFPRHSPSSILKIRQVDLNHDKNEQILSSGELRRVAREGPQNGPEGPVSLTIGETCESPP